MGKGNESPAPALPPAEWMEEARREIAEAEARFPGSEAERYCVARGLSAETARAFRLGHAEQGGRPWVCIPWLDGSGAVCAVKHRAAFDAEHGRRFRSKPGSRPVLFGLHLVPPTARVLVATEGEFNCMAAFQALRGIPGVCAVSIGSQSAREGLLLLPRLARKVGAEVALVWMDEGERAAEAAETLRGEGIRAVAAKSPDGKDAADILRECGEEFLRGLLLELLSDVGDPPRPDPSAPQGAAEALEDGYDPFAEPGSEARAPERLWARLLALGCRVLLDDRGRLRVRGAEGLPEWMKAAAREDRPALEALLRRLGDRAYGPGGYVGSALWCESARCIEALRGEERRGCAAAGRLRGILEELDAARTEGRSFRPDPAETDRLLDEYLAWWRESERPLEGAELQRAVRRFLAR
ncbi:MAG: hypothetical protein ACK41F_03630 [Fimbriimonadaceae bacterium]